MKNKMKEPNLEITYPKFLQNDIVRLLWHKLFCKNGWHLFDEVQSVDSHYLFCDACALTIWMDTNKTVWDYITEKIYLEGKNKSEPLES